MAEYIIYKGARYVRVDDNVKNRAFEIAELINKLLRINKNVKMTQKLQCRIMKGYNTIFIICDKIDMSGDEKFSDYVRNKVEPEVRRMCRSWNFRIESIEGKKMNRDTNKNKFSCAIRYPKSKVK